MNRARYVKNINEVPAYRLTQPEGHNRTVALLVDKVTDGSQNLSMGFCIIDPKSKTPKHVHENEEEAMYILKGEGKAEIGNNTYVLSEGTVIFCPPKIIHQITNPNSLELSFIFVYGPQGPEQSVKKTGTPTKSIVMKTVENPLETSQKI